MQAPVEISFRDMERSETLTNEILGKAKKLGEVFDRITRCQVLVEAPHRRHHRGNLYGVHIQLFVPRRVLIVGRESHDEQQHEDPQVAVRDAFDAMLRQLKEYVREMRGEKKLHASSLHGQIAKICLPEGLEHPERGYGLISTCDGREVCFHADSLVDVEFHRLELGSEVQFVEELGDDGPQGSSVRLVGQHQHHPVD